MRRYSYCEVSPSGTGVKAYFVVAGEDIEPIRALLPPRADGSPIFGCTWAEPGQSDHPQALELHIDRRFYAWTGQHLASTPDLLRLVGIDFFAWLALEAGPALTGKPTIPAPKAPSARERQGERREQRQAAESATRGDTGQPIRTRIEAMIAEPRPNAARRRLAQRWQGDWTGVRDTSGSGLAFALAFAVKAAGFCRQDVLAAVAEHAEIADWAAGADARQLDRLWERTSTEADDDNDRSRLPVTPTNPERVVDEIARVLAATPHIFDRGIPVTLSRDAATGALRIEMMSPDRTVTEIHRAGRPFEYVLDKETGEFEEQDCELPVRFATRYLAESTDSRRLRPLNGTTSAPLLQADGTIHAVEGYDATTALWCYDVPDIAVLVPAVPTRRDAEQALRTLRQTFRTFCFADALMIQDDRTPLQVVDISRPPGGDESGFLVALLTAVCRASLHLAPGVLITAPALSGAGSGKGLLARCIASIAFGTTPSAITAGATAEELEKGVAASLLAGSAVLFLDNLNNTSLRSDLLASAITERPCDMRVLGASKLVKLNATTLILITGNGLSVSEDLARRFVGVELDAHLEDPEARAFTGDILADIRERRPELLAAALTIWRWGRHNEVSIAAGKPLGSFGQWSRWVRDPLLALGCRDPAERIAAAKAGDQRRQQVAEMLSTWWRMHGDQLLVASGLHDDVTTLLDPSNRGRQFKASQLLKLAGTRVGGFVLNTDKPAGKWSPTKYYVSRVSEDSFSHEREKSIGGHRGKTTEKPQKTANLESRADPYAPPYASDATPYAHYDAPDHHERTPYAPNGALGASGGGIGGPFAERM